MDPFEKRMLLDFFGSIATESVLRVCHHTVDQVFGLLAQVGLLGDHKVLSPVEDLLPGLAWLIRVKRRVAHQHLKHDHAEAPPVHRLIIAFLPDDLWSYIIWCANRTKGQSPPLFAVIAKLFI
jgi:hypothetical protein